MIKSSKILGYGEIPASSYRLFRYLIRDREKVAGMPVTSGKFCLTVDGEKRKCSAKQGYVLVDRVQSGNHSFRV
jgi:hypothetical protein